MSCVSCGKTTSSKWYKGPICATCKSRAFRLFNPKYHSEYQRKRLQNPEIKKSLAVQNANNLNRKARQLARRKERYKDDIHYRLRVILRTRLLKAMKKETKTGSVISNLGCTIEQFKSYLESKFEPGMTWDNQGNGDGKWNIDHKRPLSSFDLTDEKQFKEACLYNNLQPMWFRDNLTKSDKYE